MCVSVSVCVCVRAYIIVHMVASVFSASEERAASLNLYACTYICTIICRCVALGASADVASAA